MAGYQLVEFLRERPKEEGMGVGEEREKALKLIDTASTFRTKKVNFRMDR